MKGNLTAKAFHGIKWSYASTGITSVLQIFLSAIMARLLSPTAFGLVAMASVVVSFGGYFAKMGIGPALVQKKNLHEADVHAAFILSTTLGLLVALVVVGAAPLATLLFDQPDVIPVVRALGLSFLITGVSAPSLHLLQRNLDFRSLGIISIGSYVIAYGIIGIGLAFYGFGVWSLVVASLTQLGIAALLAIRQVRHGFSLVRAKKHYRPLLSFGSRLSMIGLLDFTGSSLDKLLIGRYLGAGALGLYDRAHLLAFLPARKLSTSFSNVLFPSFSRMQSNVAQLRRGYLTTILLFGAVLIPACVGLSVTSREAVLLLLGAQWLDAIPVLQILTLAVALRILTGFSTITCEAIARLNVRIVLQLLFIALLCVFFYLFRERGLTGFALALLLAQGARHLGYTLVMQRTLHIPFRDLIRAYLPAVLYSVIIGGILFVAADALRLADVPVALVFGIEMMIGALLLALLITFGSVSNIRQDVEVILAKLNLAPATKLLHLLRRLPSPRPLLVLVSTGAIPVLALAVRHVPASWIALPLPWIRLAWKGLASSVTGMVLFALCSGLLVFVGMLVIRHRRRTSEASPPPSRPPQDEKDILSPRERVDSGPHPSV